MSDTAAWRILDAAANRAEEGLRVVEDVVRFALDDAHLTRLLKELRHDLAAAVSRLSSHKRLAGRDTLQDVGAAATTASEQRRDALSDVAAASFKRAQQALRSLEEVAKTIDPVGAPQLESLRYRCYTLERAVFTTADSAARLDAIRLYLLIDGRESADALTDLAGKLIDAGVQAVQLRDKQLPDRELLDRARRLREVTSRLGAVFIVNDRADIARLSRADGVHVGQEELPVKDARAIVGTEALIGVSTHSQEQARQAVLEGANYIGVGPTFPSGTKQFSAFPGVDFAKAVAAEIRLPSFAIGGITLDKLPSVQQAGIPRVAVSGAILAADDPIAATRKFAERLAAC